jgi:hypothetical protein
MQQSAVEMEIERTKELKSLDATEAVVFEREQSERVKRYENGGGDGYAR